MRRLFGIFGKARGGEPLPAPAAPAQTPSMPKTPIDLETVADFYNGLYIALPEDALEQMAIEHYCLMLYAFRDIPEIGHAGIEKIRNVRRELFGLIADENRVILPEHKIDRAKVVSLLLGHYDDLKTVYDALQTPWADLAARAGFRPDGYTLYRPAGEPLWAHLSDNDQFKSMYTDGIATFMRVFERLPQDHAQLPQPVNRTLSPAGRG